MPDSGPLQVILENIPRLLRELLLWGVWIVRPGDRKGKLPISPMDGGILAAARPREWSRFEDASFTYRQGGHPGLGVLMRLDARVIGINLNDCTDENGKLQMWAASIVSGLPTYWELSPSGHGLRGFVRGTLPVDCPNKLAMAGGRVEAYCDGRFMTVTGHRLPGSAEDVQDCPAQLESFIALLRTPPLPATSEAEVAAPELPAGNRPGTQPIEIDAWPEPERLDIGLVRVAEFDPALLPDGFRPYAIDVAERLQVPLDFLGAALIVSFGSVTGRRARIAPKRHDDWEECGNLWGGIIASPGSMKTPSIKRVLKILHRLEEEAAQQFREATAQYERELEGYEERKQAWKRQSGARANQVEDPGAFAEPEPQEPTCVRFVVNDATLPMLQQILAQNLAGLLLFRDELAGFFGMLDSKGRESERPFYLESWSGDQPFTLDRITRGTIRASRICLSLFGGIQPVVLRHYLVGAIFGGDGDDGLAQRLQVLVYPDMPEDWENIDREPNREAEEHATNVFRFVAAAQPEVFLARFDHEAQRFFDDWRATLERRLRREPMPSYLQAHFAKYRGLMPRIALLCHLADSGFSPEVPLHQAQRAARWCTYLETHARRVYAEGSPRSMAAVVGEKLRQGALGVRFTLREVRKKGWAGLDNPVLLRAIFGELEEAGWIRKEPNQPSERGGRPAEAYIVNPRVFQSRAG